MASASAGIPVAVASDNTRDQFFAYGDLDLLDVFGQVPHTLLSLPGRYTVMWYMHSILFPVLLHLAPAGLGTARAAGRGLETTHVSEGKASLLRAKGI